MNNSGENRDEHKDDDIIKRLESVGDDVDGREYYGIPPPSPKKRKAVSQNGTALPSTYSLAQMLVQFGDIQLNKDFYDSIERTESRCDVGSDSVRENDREAFNTALEKIQHCIQEAIDMSDDSKQSLIMDDIDLITDKGRVLKAFRLITMSLEVIQFLIDLGGGTSTSASLTVEETDSVARSLSKSTSQNINVQDKEKRQCGSIISDGDEGQSPLKLSHIHHGKHPRQHQQEETKETSQPSEIASLVSNEPPKRQRKDEDEACSKLPGVGDNHVEQERDSTSNDGSIQEHSPVTSIKEKHHSNEKSVSVCRFGGEPSKQKMQGQDHWGSSLVCADLSLSEVGSKIYWPFMSALKAAGVCSLSNEKDKASFETIISTYTGTNERSADLADMIYQSVESTYRDYDIQANVAQKALGLVAAAFERILASYIKDITKV